jgi:hypothetical protein
LNRATLAVSCGTITGVPKRKGSGAWTDIPAASRNASKKPEATAAGRSDDVVHKLV